MHAGFSYNKYPLKAVSGYDQGIPQLQTTDKATAPQSRATQQSRDTKQSNQLSLTHQDDCKTGMNIK